MSTGITELDRPRRVPPTPDGRMRFTREDYHRMIESGVLTEDDKVELLDGEIVNMLPIGPIHTSTTDKLNTFFVPKLAGKYICRVQGPLGLSDVSEPEPDFQILRMSDDFYRTRHPNPDEVVLLIEVAQSSLERDRGKKLRLYAAAGIAEYWIVDVTRDVLTVYREPDTSGYRMVQPFSPGQVVAPAALAECQLDLAWLFH